MYANVATKGTVNLILVFKKGMFSWGAVPIVSTKKLAAFDPVKRNLASTTSLAKAAGFSKG